MRRRKRRLVAAGGLVAGLLAAACALVMWPLDPSLYLSTHASPEIRDANGRLLHVFLNDSDQWSMVRRLTDYTPRLVDATLAAEDRRFYSHPGVDPIGVARAVWQNMTNRRVVSGASTLTMQLVKAAGTGERTIAGKARQALLAMRLERRVTKDDILCAYLNTAPYGGNLIGAEAAAWRYFGKPALELTLPEAATIAALPKAPTTIMPLDHPDKALKRRNYVLNRMRRTDRISEDEYQRAIAAPLGVEWHAFPSAAPHVAMRLREQAQGSGVLRVTLDAGIQTAVERASARWVRRYFPRISNAAAIVVDVPSAHVLAWMGSADFLRTPGGGQVDACRARRAPGSTLKPFTYALALERNVLYPCETLLDDTLDYGRYSPENFEGDYSGLVSAAEALKRSLNVPAVMTLQRTGVEPLQTLLRGLGLTTLNRLPDEYGLGLTLGDCEARLDELAEAYCTLAALGRHRPLSVLADTPVPDGEPRLSRGVCAALFGMLEQPLPGEWDTNIVKASGVPTRACWKTGTSAGYRDAWAFVFNRQYLVGVWLGNNNGAGVRDLVGLRAALPLAARIFRQLPPSSAPVWPDASDGLRTASVCAVSGLPASPWCSRKKDVLLPAEQYVNRVCGVHYPATAAEGDKADRERWPGSARGWDLAKVATPATESALEPSASARRGAALRIQDPVAGAQYVLTGESEGDRIRLRSSVDNEVPLFWYLDGAYLGVSRPESPLLLDLKPGDHALACMSGAGAVDHVSFRVEHPRGPARFVTP